MLKKAGITIILSLAVLVFVNLVSEQYFFRIDFTEDNRYTLSKATEDLLEELNETVTIKAYFTEDLPPDIKNVCSEFEDYLIEYKRLSNDNIIYSFINPNESEELEREAMEAGVQPVMINVRDKDQIKQQKSFLGVAMELGEQKEVIPFIQPGTPLEYILSTSIKKMMVTDKPVIGLVQGHGEPGMDEISEVISELSILYQVEPYTFSDQPVPEHYSSLAIVRPKDSLPTNDIAKLDAFLNNGGNLFLALNSVEGDLQASSGSAHTTGLENWLSQKGLIIEPKFVIDANCAMITVQRQQGMFRFASNMQFPFLPIISNFSDHPVSSGLEAVVFQFASPMRFQGDTGTSTFMPLAYTSANSGSLPAPQYFDVNKQWADQDFSSEKLVVAAGLQTGNSRMVVVGDGDFPVSGSRNNRQQMQGDNVNLMVNAIDWLSDDTGLIELRTKGIQFRPLIELEDSTKSLLKYLNFFLPILLLLIYGLLRMQINRSRRIKRMQEDYA